MVQDLFLKRPPAKVRLYKWMCQKKHALSHEIIDWGRREYCNWPMRRLNELKNEGKIERMPEPKKISYYGKTREQAWQIKCWTNTPVTQR